MRRRWAGSDCIGKVEQRIRRPVDDRIVLAVTPDQRLVLLAEIDAQSPPDTVIVAAFADAAFGEQRGLGAAAARQRIFGAERKGVMTAVIAVAGKGLPVV